MEYKIAGKKLVTVDGIKVNFTVIEKPDFLAGGGVALVKDEEVAKEFVKLAALTARVKELEEALIKAESALTYANWDGAFDDNHTAQDVINARDAARAALRGEA